MTTLHIINQAKTHQELAGLFEYFAPQDTVIFIQDGCYNLNVRLPEAKLSYFALKEDMAARSVVNEQVNMIDYGEFVDLTLSCSKTISW